MQNIFISLLFAEYCEFDRLRCLHVCLCSVYLSALIKGLEDEVKSSVILKRMRDYC